ncbi:MAG TPA: GntR family transcriptional regulator [Bacteroidales bacterium]|nr:GntR family transcriptional regulator [Bacteroidales bacterium]
MEFNENQAIYLQIADYFCENILQRKWQKGEKIPSIREIAVKVEVNPNTAMRTYNYLQDKGIIFNKRGIGYFVSDDGYGKTLELKKEQFINEDLPQMFRLFDLLQFSFDDLKKYYEEYKKSQSN